MDYFKLNFAAFNMTSFRLLKCVVVAHSCSLAFMHKSLIYMCMSDRIFSHGGGSIYVSVNIFY